VFYLPVILIAALVATAIATPPTATRMGFVAVVAAVLLCAVAVLTGNWLLFYLSAFSGPFGLLVLLLQALGMVRRRTRSY
jgi:hypothetical protein